MPFPPCCFSRLTCCHSKKRRIHTAFIYHGNDSFDRKTIVECLSMIIRESIEGLSHIKPPETAFSRQKGIRALEGGMMKMEYASFETATLFELRFWMQILVDHAREECYYLTKLSWVSEVKHPNCDPAKPEWSIIPSDHISSNVHTTIL